MQPEEGPLGVWDMLRTFWRELATAIVLVAGANTVGYTLTAYMPVYINETLGYSTTHGVLLTLPILLLVAFLVPTMGWVSDHVGRKPVILSAALSTVVLAVPSFLLLDYGPVWSTLLGLALLAYPTAAYVGNLASSLPALFPTSSRYGGMGISYNVAVAVFGGTAALIMQALVTVTGSKLAPAFWLMGTSGAALIALFNLRETARRPLPGSMPSVASREEVVELVKTQEENPDLDVSEIFAAAPAHLVDTEPTVAEARAEVEVEAVQPAGERRYARQEPDVAHARIAFRRHEHGRRVAIDHQGFEDQAAIGAQGVAQLGEVLQRFAAVVEHAHGQGQVEVARGDIVEGQRQVGAVLRAEEAFQREVLREVMPGGVETECHFRPCAEGAVEVVAVAAANVQHVFAGKVHAGGE
mgnify:CR=1 FL=1